MIQTYLNNTPVTSNWENHLFRETKFDTNLNQTQARNINLTTRDSVILFNITDFLYILLYSFIT